MHSHTQGKHIPKQLLLSPPCLTVQPEEKAIPAESTACEDAAAVAAVVAAVAAFGETLPINAVVPPRHAEERKSAEVAAVAACV